MEKLHPKKLIGNQFVKFLASWALLITFYFYFSWHSLFLPDETLNFGDLKYVLICAQFEVSGADSVSCFDYMYGKPLLYALSSLTFLHPYGDIVASVIVLGGLAVFAQILSHTTSRYEFLFIFALLLTPPTVLLIQRGNIDIVMLALTAGSINHFLRERYTTSLIFAFVATLVKFYTLPLFLLICMKKFLYSDKLAKKTSLVVLAIAVTTWTAISVGQIPWLPSDARNAFGLPIFGEYLRYLTSGPGYQNSKWISIALGSLVLFAMTIILRLLHFFQSINEFKIEMKNGELLWYFNFLGIFISGISIDYRLVFLIPVTRVISHLPKSAYKYIVVPILGTFTFSYPFNYSQLIGDILLFFTIAACFPLINLKSIGILLGKG